MDFMSDELYNGQRIKLLTLVDKLYPRESGDKVAHRFGKQRLVEVMMQV
jgi:hypothetical protein